MGEARSLALTHRPPIPASSLTEHRNAPGPSSMKNAPSKPKPGREYCAVNRSTRIFGWGSVQVGRHSRCSGVINRLADNGDLKIARKLFFRYTVEVNEITEYPALRNSSSRDILILSWSPTERTRPQQIKSLRAAYLRQSGS